MADSTERFNDLLGREADERMDDEEALACARHIAEQGEEAGFGPEVIALAREIEGAATAAPLTWGDAVEAALEPTALDRARVTSGVFGTGEPLIGEDGKVADFNIVRERAAQAYCRAHEGRMAEVRYCAPGEVGDRTRLVYHSIGELRTHWVTYPEFVAPGQVRSHRALVLGTQVIPFAGITEIRVDGDRSVVTL